MLVGCCRRRYGAGFVEIDRRVLGHFCRSWGVRRWPVLSCKPTLNGPIVSAERQCVRCLLMGSFRMGIEVLKGPSYAQAKAVW